MKNSLLLFLSCTPLISLSQEKRPNIIVILADDMGYSDIGCMGSEIKTPNIDALAKKGVLFTNFYNTSRSCPSRAALLTGQYQWDAGMGCMTDTKCSLKEYQGYLNKECVTIAEALQLGGYNTVMSGKWHVGGQRECWPDKRGFQHSYSTPVGGGVYFYPSKFYNRTLYKDGVEEHPAKDWYSTDGFTDAAIDFVKGPEAKQKPFFMYLAYIAPHFPLQAKPEDIAKYKGYYDKGYEKVRDERVKRQIKLGIISDKSSIPAPEAPVWDKVKNKETEARKMTVYAAMVDCMDQNIGRLIKSLKENGLYDNTVIIFLSDNGGCMQNFNKTPNVEIGSNDSNASYGYWYNVSNTPLRLGKAKEHEGGVKTPLIFSWPDGMKKGNVKIRETAHIMDIMPTCLELAKVNYPESYDGHKLSALDGKSFLPLVYGKKQDKNRVYFWEHEGNKAVRTGNWKLVQLRKHAWELYKIDVDPFETNNVISQYEDKAKELEGKYNDWAKEHGVSELPLPKK